MSSAAKASHWYILSRIDVLRDNSYGCVVTLGDSITDGRTPSGNDNTNYRWPDVLAARLHADPDTIKVGVINQGIGANAVLYDNTTGGSSAQHRYDHDVIGQPGVKWAIIFEGVNDIGSASSSAVVTNLTNAYQEFITKAHNAGILIYGATITPFKGNGYYSVNHEAYRQAVNSWIRDPNHFDAVIDFDAAVRDPCDPAQINPIYQYEWLHFNPAGYAAMANFIDLDLFTLTADLDEDGIVNLVDYAILASQWLQEPGSPSADIAPMLAGDGVVDSNDLFLMTIDWLREE
jgi:lysophospholipase L1-like esterase